MPHFDCVSDANKLIVFVGVTGAAPQHVGFEAGQVFLCLFLCPAAVNGVSEPLFEHSEWSCSISCCLKHFLKCSSINLADLVCKTFWETIYSVWRACCLVQSAWMRRCILGSPGNPVENPLLFYLCRIERWMDFWGVRGILNIPGQYCLLFTHDFHDFQMNFTTSTH